MKLVQHAHEFEYRDPQGVDRVGRADLWSSEGGDHAVLVLKDVDEGPHAWAKRGASVTLLENARRALSILMCSLLPFLVPGALRLDVWVLRAPEDDPDGLSRGSHSTGKPRALVLAAR